MNFDDRLLVVKGAGDAAPNLEQVSSIKGVVNLLNDELTHASVKREKVEELFGWQQLNDLLAESSCVCLHARRNNSLPLLCPHHHLYFPDHLCLRVRATVRASRASPSSA